MFLCSMTKLKQVNLAVLKTSMKIDMVEKIKSIKLLSK